MSHDVNCALCGCYYDTKTWPPHECKPDDLKARIRELIDRLDEIESSRDSGTGLDVE